MSLPTSRHTTPLDTLVTGFDRLLKSALGPHRAHRPYPGANHPETLHDPTERRRIAGLMRVNHAGEICAQALYHGQAATARLGDVREAMHMAAQEEADHLAWCAQRLSELGDRPSVLDPLWYVGSFAIGALAGLSGDQRSLGFVAETENQVIAHLQSHLQQLPENDLRTQAIIQQMMTDEAQHGSEALKNGGALPPQPIQHLMKLTAKVMTFTAQRI